MIVEGYKKTVEKVEIDVSYNDILIKLRKKLERKLFPNYLFQHDSFYISSTGDWETWDNGHGSGYTKTYEKATEADIKHMNLLDEFFNTAYKLGD